MCFRSVLASSCAVLFVCAGLLAQSSASITARPQDRITTSLNSGENIVLSGNTHPLAIANSSVATSANVPMERMILTLKPDSLQSAQLEQLIAQQQDPKSPLYHRFLSPQDFGNQFGVSQNDLNKTIAWLAAHGFTIDEIPAGHRSIVFSGNSSQIDAAFSTQIRQFTVAGQMHFANVSDPQVPVALSSVVGGVVKLHNFQHKPSLLKVQSAQYTSGNGSHYLTPADYATIYNLKSLYSAGVDGTGQSIAVIARSNIYKSDVESFRQLFSLPANDPTMVMVNNDPGVLEGDTTETTLDTEWAGAIAPKATVKVVVAASTNSADGIDLAAQYAVNNNIAPVITLSYGSCEAYMGSSEMSFYNSLWQQAAAQGQTVLVSSGDSGAAGCNGGSDSTGSIKGVNGICTSPYSTCVGGTEFNDGGNPGQYWYTTNSSSYGSAISYIPEVSWNESGANGGSGLWAGGGGASLYFAKPTWQAGPGVVADGRRDVPDVSLTASSHDGYFIQEFNNTYSVGGTSAAAPSFAGMMALVNQKIGSRQGNANTTLYPLAANQANGGAAIFHDITGGSNSVPGVAGFNAVAGYDMASGLGSVDAAQMVNHWTDTAKPVAPTLALTASSTNLTVKAGSSLQTIITSTASSTLRAAVTVTVSGVPTGLTATLGASGIASPGSGAVALTVAAASSVRPGSYAFSVNAQGGGQTATLTITVVVPSPTFTLAANSTVSAYAGDSAILAVSLTPQNGFSSVVSMGLRGLPAGITVAFSSPTINGASVANINLNFTLAKTAAPGSYPLTITATGGGVTQTAPVTLVVSVHASCTLAANPGSVKLTAGQAAAVQVVCGSVQGTFGAPLGFAVSGQWAGVTAAFSSPSVAAGTTASLNISAAITAQAGTHNLVVVASGLGFTQSLTIPVTLSAPSTFTLTAPSPSLSAKLATSGQMGFSVAHVGSFNSAIAVTLAGVPAGVTATLLHPSLPAPGDGTDAILFTVSSSVKPGTYPIGLLASGGGVTQSANLSLTVLGNADFSFAVSTIAITLQQGGAAVNETVSTGNFSGGFNSGITITYSNLAPGMNWRWVGGTAANNLVNSTVAFYVPAYTPAGVYPITVTATGGGVTHTATVNVTVVAAGSAAKR